VEACGTPPPGRRYVHVCDCEADDFGFYDACRRTGCDFVNRVYQQRRAALGHPAAADIAAADIAAKRGLLVDLARTLTPLGGKTLELRTRTRVRKRVKRKGRRHASKCLRDVPARRAKLLVSAGPVTVF